MFFNKTRIQQKNLLETIFWKAREIATQLEIVDVVKLEQSVYKHGITAATGKVRLPLTEQDVRFGSTVERNFLLGCRLDHQIVSVEAQPFSIVFNTSNSKQLRQYTPDYYVSKDISLGATKVCIGQHDSEDIIVEIKREADLKYTSEEDIERYAAGIAWADLSLNRDYSFYAMNSVQTTLDKYLERYGHVAGEMDSPASKMLKNCLLADTKMTVEEARQFLTGNGYSSDEIEHGIQIGIAKGWAEIDTIDHYSGKNILQWNPCSRLS